MRAFAALASALWTYSAGRRRMLVAYIGLFIIGNIINLLEPFAIGHILNSIQQAGSLANPLKNIFFWLVVLFSLSVGFWFFHGPARVIEQNLAFHVRTNFIDRLFGVITSLPVQWHKNNHSGQTINRMRKSSNALHDFSSNSFQIIEMIMKLIGSIVALFLLMPLAAIVAVSVSVLSLTVVFLYDRVLFKRYSSINEHEHFTAAALHDYITNIMTVVSLRLETLAQSEVFKRMTVYFPFASYTVILEESKWFLKTVIISLMTVGILGWYMMNNIEMGALPLAGTFFMLFEYLQKIASSFYTFAWKYSATIHQYADWKSVQPILQADRADYHSACTLPEDWEKIDVENLSFTYKDEEKRTHHLKDVSVTLERGKKIAFIGESGSGKSTFMALIRGLYTADEGTVRADGKTLKHGLRDVGSTVTLIPQEPEIFENTVEYNVTLDTRQSEEEVMEDITLACFDSVLKKLPKGLQTNTAEKGVNLSGGEKQRLALARGVFAAKHSSIILLDEPTSSVDPINERKIYENIFARFPDRAIVSALHKLHLLEMFDEAYVFEDGRVVESGSIGELLGQGSRLKSLWEAYHRQVQKN